MQGKDGSYGTSLCWQTAMDESCDVILAYKQNDRYLLPDHGAPVRIIIPGHIGGRMVKWLEEITVTEQESDNFYHYHDNRVLPPGIEQEQAKADGASPAALHWCKVMPCSTDEMCMILPLLGCCKT